MIGDFCDFVYEMGRYVPENARIMYCQFRGDPNADIPGKWRARVLRQCEDVDEKANIYLAVSAMQRNSRGEFRRRAENFAGGLLLMIDDIGDGPGAKFPLSVIEPLRPTALVETSRGNFQATYFFDSLVTDRDQFDALIRAFVQRQFLGRDPGQAGVNRVFRPPVGVNGKPKHDGWRVRLAEWNPECRYSIARIVDAFELELVPRVRRPLISIGDRGDRVRAFVSIYDALRAAGMLKRDEPDRAGWMDVQCPWIGEHSARADTGAAIREPEAENDWYGAFRCHHGSCEGRGWSDLTQWLADEQAEVLERINAAAPRRWRFGNDDLSRSNGGDGR